MSDPIAGTSAGPVADLAAAPVRVDVVVVSWNVRDRLRTCLAGLLEDCPGLELDVVVVDNASVDGSAELVAEQFPSVQLERNAANVLYAPAVVQGARRGEAPLLLLLNPDCELAASQLLELAAALQADPQLAAVAPRLCHADGSTQAALMDHPGFWSPLFFGTPLERWWPNSPELRRWFCRERDLERDQDCPQPPAACFLVRRSVWEELGGFDERLELFFNDADLCTRMAAAGQRIRYLASVGVVHHTGSSTAQLPDFASHWHRDRLRYHRKHFGLLAVPLVKLCTSWTLADHLLSGLVRRLRGGSADPALPLLRAWGRFLLQ